MNNEALEIIYLPFFDLKPAEYNTRKINKKQQDQISISLVKYGWTVPAVVNSNPERENVIIGGHQRAKIAQHIYENGFYLPDTTEQHFIIQGCKYEAGKLLIPCIYKNLDFEQEKELNIRLNKAGAGWDQQKLVDFFDLETELLDFGFSKDELDLGLFPDEKPQKEPKKPASSFVDPGDRVNEPETSPQQPVTSQPIQTYQPAPEPATGSQADDLRGPFEVPPFNLLDTRSGYWAWRNQIWQDVIATAPQADAVVLELVTRWFNVPGGSILELLPAGLEYETVAETLNYPYKGVTAALDVAAQTGGQLYDLVYLEPEYGSASVPGLPVLEEILIQATAALKGNRFIAVMITDERNAIGVIMDLPGEVVRILNNLGLRFYNNFVVTTGSFADSVNQKFNQNRQAAAKYKNLIVFYSGNPADIAQNYGSVVDEI